MDYGKVKNISANISGEMHELIEAACKIEGMDKATFVRCACRLLLIDIAELNGGANDPKIVAYQVAFSRNAYDCHKALSIPGLRNRIKQDNKE